MGWIGDLKIALKEKYSMDGFMVVG